MKLIPLVTVFNSAMLLGWHSLLRRIGVDLLNFLSIKSPFATRYWLEPVLGLFLSPRLPIPRPYHKDIELLTVANKMDLQVRQVLGESVSQINPLLQDFATFLDPPLDV